MQRTADPELPHRILKAADALWQSGRSVAAGAATTTQKVYSDYADREALLTALRALAFQRFSANAQRGEIERYTTDLLRAGVDESW